MDAYVGCIFVTWGAKLSNIVRVGTFYLTVKEEAGVISRAGTRTITLRIHSKNFNLKLYIEIRVPPVYNKDGALG